ncbi:DUF397 domain-containing protein [Kitasatospora cinereorecta]
MANPAGRPNTAARSSSRTPGPGAPRCLEVAGGFTAVIPVRDSKNPHGPALTFAADGWSSFVSAVKDGALSA